MNNTESIKKGELSKLAKDYFSLKQYFLNMPLLSALSNALLSDFSPASEANIAIEDRCKYQMMLLEALNHDMLRRDGSGSVFTIANAQEDDELFNLYLIDNSTLLVRNMRNLTMAVVLLKTAKNIGGAVRGLCEGFFSDAVRHEKGCVILGLDNAMTTLPSNAPLCPLIAASILLSTTGLPDKTLLRKQMRMNDYDFTVDTDKLEGEIRALCGNG